MLYVALQPGYEDLRVVAYYGLIHGARVRVAFVTNGEAGEHNDRAMYPHELAATHRLEAAVTLERFNAEAYFLNMPDVASASDSLVVRSFWAAESLQARCRALILEFLPDLILLAGDRETDDPLRMSILRSDVLAAVREVAKDSIAPWKVSRLAVESASPNAVVIPVDRRTKTGGPTARMLADSLGSLYASMSVQRATWTQSMTASFSVVHPPTFTGKSLEAGIPGNLPGSVRSLESALRAFKQKLARISRPQAQQTPLLRELRRLLDTVDTGIMRHPMKNSIARRVLLSRKAELEKIRNELLGVSVTFSTGDTVVTDRQVIELYVTDVKGTTASGKTELFIPAVDQGWVLNEDVRNRVPLEIGKEYRLLSPASLDYNYPQAMYGLTHSTVRKPFYFFVIHRAEDRSRSFIWRGDLRLWYAPRFTTEVLTPIVCAMNDEQVVVRLTNHSRDPVRDSVYVRDSLVSARGRMFRLSAKGATHTDTLTLTWKDTTFSGDYLTHVLIDGISTGRFVARGFNIETDRTRTVAVVTAMSDSPTMIALRRLGYRPAAIEPGDHTSLLSSGYDVVIVDRHVMESATQAVVGALVAYTERGGHVVILAQREAALTGLPMFADARAVSDFRLDERTPVQIDTQHVLIRRPNRILYEDFDGWLVRRAYHAIGISNAGLYEVPVRNDKTGYPMVLTRRWGKGRATYVDLALTPQWMNVHAGALRLLANLVAMR